MHTSVDDEGVPCGVAESTVAEGKDGFGNVIRLTPTPQWYKSIGDEFVILVQDEELDKCQELLDGIREKMNKTMQDSSLEPWQRISTAFGWARYAQGDDVASVFRKADAAMYEDKNRMHAKR